MTRINLNKLAQEIVRREGNSYHLNIAQVKAVLRHTMDVFASFRRSTLLQVFEEYDKARGRMAIKKGRAKGQQ